jgi:hypothetical protein
MVVGIWDVGEGEGEGEREKQKEKASYLCNE